MAAPPPPALAAPTPAATPPLSCAWTALTVGKISAIAAAVLKTFRLIIIGSICGI
jgi:hypothetical protein